MKLFSFVLILLVSLSAQDALVHFYSFDRTELKSQAFELTSDQKVSLEIIGPRLGNYSESSYVWILNLKTREPVWLLDDAESDRHDNRRLRSFSDEVSLKKGAYKIFYATNRNGFNVFRDGDFSFGDLFRSETYDNEYRKRDVRKFELKLFAKGSELKNDESYLASYKNSRIVDLTKAEHSQYERLSLEVKSTTDVHIYAVGEVTRDGNYDAAWIKNLSTGKRVWQLDHYDSEHAGGARKNRMFNETVKLEKGQYVLTFASDDSHNFDNWNSIPPYDPDAWGVSVYVKNKSNISVSPYKKSEEKNVIVSLTELGDNEYVSKGFTLTEDSEIRVYALGEGTRNDMADYGWIINMKNHRKVWEMDYRDTEHAGGASKNRLSDELLKLDAGSYKVYFVTDGSHAYARSSSRRYSKRSSRSSKRSRDYDYNFNSSRPYDAEKWGITVYGAGSDFDMDDVKSYEEPEESDIIAKIIRVRDHESESVRFELDEDTDVRVYALGEGFRSDMADYGWIKNTDTGRTVWEMDYRDTDHAGGARKNRVADEVIRLKKGEYKVYYRTDGSHSFRDWNDSPPMDQEHWGITIYAEAD